MTSRPRTRLAAVALALALLSGSGAMANCINFGGFAIFQCADAAYFNPPPVPVGFDPNNHPTNVSAVMWQLGFGNNEPGRCVNTTSQAPCTTTTGCTCNSGLINKVCSISSLPDPNTFCNGNSGLGTGGTGNSGTNDFNGNDSGVFAIDLRDARVGTGQSGLQAGTLCLSSNNWANAGMDGCADNVRTTAIPTADDDILNPYYDVYQSRSFGSKGIYSIDWQQDYGMATLLKTTPDARYFAVAAVATLNRGSDRSGVSRPSCDGTCELVDPNNPSGPRTCKNGPNPGISCTSDAQCATTPGDPAVCDVRPGFFTFNDVANGLANPLVVGKFNVVPWQQVPKPSANCVANCGGSPRTVRFDWTPAIWYHDKSNRPSTNPSLAPQDPNRAPGVGVMNLLTKTDPNNFWRGLIRYDLESATATAANLDPNGRLIPASLTFTTAVANVPQPTIDPNTGNPATNLISTTTSAGPDTCWRIRVKFGKKPETFTTSTTNCRLGKCGDRGFDAASSDGAVITCVGGALFSESFTSTSATKSRGDLVVSWTTSTELSITGFNVYAVNKGVETKLNSSPIACSECNTSLGANYQASFPLTLVKGSKGVIVEALALNSFRSALTPIQ